MVVGRKRSEPAPATAERLRDLFERKQQADLKQRAAAVEFAVAVYEACELEGASRRGVAEAVGIGASTVHDWVRRGRRLRQKD